MSVAIQAWKQWSIKHVRKMWNKCEKKMQMHLKNVKQCISKTWKHAFQKCEKCEKHENTCGKMWEKPGIRITFFNTFPNVN